MNTTTHLFPDDGHTPNNPTLPLIVMHGTAAAEAGDPAAWFEKTFQAHDWGAVWRWGVYDYHHFHSNSHEVLGVSRGQARLILGGENGEEFDVTVGDVIVIPAGVGHKCLQTFGDFQVVGAYPRGKEPDLIRSDDDKADLDAARRRIADVSLPRQDPIHGEDGPVLKLWH